MKVEVMGESGAAKYEAPEITWEFVDGHVDIWGSSGEKMEKLATYRLDQVLWVTRVELT